LSKKLSPADCLIYKISDNNFVRDEVVGFLMSAAISHNIPLKSVDWYNYKYTSSPLSSAILAIAVDGDLIVGCVALGSYEFYLNGNVIPGYISYETFVHPNYQGRGVFVKLAALAEKQSLLNGAKLLMNFPNKNSMPGFKKLGWIEEKSTAYYIRPISAFNFMRNLYSLTKAFVPSGAINTLIDKVLLDIIEPNNNFYERIVGVSTFHSLNFLQWRFLANPSGNYGYFTLNRNLFIYRIGNRGCLKEAQLLYVSAYQKIESSFWGLFFKHLKSIEKVDYIGVPLSEHHPLSKSLPNLMFFKVPNKAGFAYKILDPSICFDCASFMAIDYHTY
jgi:GNAT superfamily N-acetyltransferase